MSKKTNPTPPGVITLESLLTSPAGFALPASPLQRAVCRVIDGSPLGELAQHPDVVSGLGGADAIRAVPRCQPTEVIVLAGIRGGKSLIAAANAIRASQTCDVSRLGPGEVPRVVVISLTLDLAHVVFNHIVGTIQSRPTLRALMVGKPTADTVTLRHPSGRNVEIKVSPLSAAGGSLIARWLLGVVFDEAPRMDDQGSKSLADARTAAIGRLLPGAQLLTIGSPWAPFGPVYDLVQERFGSPTDRLVVIRGTGPAMNPAWWTPQRCERIKQTDPFSYRTDVLAEFADPETNLISSIELEAATRKAPVDLPKEDGHDYVALMDPATRGNAWTLVVVTKKRDPETFRTKRVLVLAKQWIGSKVKPLSPKAVLEEIARLVRPYGCDYIVTDQWSCDALKDIALGDTVGLALQSRQIASMDKTEMYHSLRALIADGQMEVHPDRVLRQDLLGIKKRVTLNNITIELPKTTDGRHSDYAPPTAMAAVVPIRDPEQAENRPTFGTLAYLKWVASPEYAAKQEADALAKDEAALEREQRGHHEDERDDGSQWWNAAPS